MSSYVQDTTDFLRKINKFGFFPNNSYLVPLDVKLLYTMQKESNPSKRPWKNILNERLNQK